MIAEALKRRAPAGATIAFDPPQQKRDTIFTARRVETYADGRRLFVLNQQLYSARLTVDMISSSPSEKAAQTNLDLFAVALMLVSQAGDETAKGR